MTLNLTVEMLAGVMITLLMATGHILEMTEMSGQQEMSQVNTMQKSLF